MTTLSLRGLASEVRRFGPFEAASTHGFNYKELRDQIWEQYYTSVECLRPEPARRYRAHLRCEDRLEEAVRLADAYGWLAAELYWDEWAHLFGVPSTPYGLAWAVRELMQLSLAEFLEECWIKTAWTFFHPQSSPRSLTWRLANPCQHFDVPAGTQTARDIGVVASQWREEQRRSVGPAASWIQHFEKHNLFAVASVQPGCVACYTPARQPLVALRSLERRSETSAPRVHLIPGNLFDHLHTYGDRLEAVQLLRALRGARADSPFATEPKGLHMVA